MVTTNGAAHAACANGNGALANGSDSTVVQVNFGLKPRHIYAILGGIPAGLAALGAAGYAVLPASKAEVVAVQQGFQELKAHVTTEITGLKDVNREIIVVVRELREAVAALRASPAQVAPRGRAAAPVRPQPAQPKTPALGLFGF